MKPLYICFEDNQEYILRGKKTEEFGIGKLLFSFLDFDFEQAENEIKTIKSAYREENDIKHSVLTGDFETGKIYLLLPEAYQKIIRDMSGLHPYLFDSMDSCLENFIDEAYPSMPVMADFAHRIFLYYPETPMSPQQINDFATFGGLIVPDKDLIGATNRFTDRLIEMLAEFKAFKQDLLEMIRFALDSNGNYTMLEPDKRYYLMQISNFEPYVRSKSLIDSVKIDLKMLEDVEWLEEIPNITEEVIESLQETEVYSYSFYTSRDVHALVMLEFDYMCANNLIVRRCANCGGYFHPFSSRAIYCDRIFKNGKTCKDTAAAIKYREAENQNEASRHLRKLKNTYNMRCSRSADITLRDERDDWKIMAEEKLEEFNTGKITLEEFKEAVELPDTKKE